MTETVLTIMPMVIGSAYEERSYLETTLPVLFTEKFYIRVKNL